MGRVLRRAAILGLVLAPLVALHLGHLPGKGPFSLDGSYYVHGARFVAEENRLMRSLSLYHEGLSTMPAPWDTYPLWPLLLGIVAKVTGLFFAANALPQLFYGLDLVLFALLARRLNARLGGAARWRVGEDELDAGVLIVLVVGLNFIFFQSTVFPYTEGLAFALGLASLLTLDRDDSPRWIAAAGVLAGLSCLARYQMVGLPAAAALVLLVARRLRAFAIYCLATAVIVVPWMLYAHSLLRYRAGITPWDEWVHPPTLAGHVVQFAHGIGVAFDPFSRASYFHSFGVLVLLLPVALLARPRFAILPATVGLTGIVATAMLARYESKRFEHWLFGDRHSLLFTFTIVAALVYALNSRTRAVRVIAIVIAAIGIAQGAREIIETPPPVGGGPTRGERALAAWLATNAPRATILTTNAHVLSVYTRNPLHWTDCRVTPEVTRAMLRRLPIDYVLVYGNERNCAFVHGLDDVLTPAARFDDDVVGIDVFRVTRKMASTGAPSTSQTATGLR